MSKSQSENIFEAGTDKLWKLQTTVYGLKDAARVWYLPVKEELIKVKAVMSKFDEAVCPELMANCMEFWHVMQMILFLVAQIF